MLMRLVNVEHRYSTQPGALPDKAEREALHENWVVVLVNHHTNTELHIRIMEVRAEGQYTGRLLDVSSAGPIYFESFNVLRILSRVEKALA